MSDISPRQFQDELPGGINKLGRAVAKTWHACENVLAFQLHTELYAVITAAPAILWCTLQKFSQGPTLFNADITTWRWYDVFFRSLEAMGVNGYLLSYPYIPLLLAYGIRKAWPIGFIYIAYVIICCAWGVLTQAVLRRFVAKYTLLLLPLYAFAILFVFILAIGSQIRKMLKWWRVIVFYLPFLCNLFVVDTIVLKRYFKYPASDSSFDAIFNRYLIRFLVVPVFTSLFTFTARFAALRMDNAPTNQRIALTADVTSYRAILHRILVANAGSLTETFVMIVISTFTDSILRLTCMHRDLFVIKIGAIIFKPLVFVWNKCFPDKTQSGYETKEVLAGTITDLSVPDCVKQASDDFKTSDENGSTDINDDTEPSDDDNDNAPEIDVVRAANGSDIQPPSSSSSPAGELIHDGSFGVISSDSTSTLQHSTTRLIDADVEAQSEEEPVDYDHDNGTNDMYSIYTSFLTNESIVDSACIISVTIFTIAYHLIFNNADKDSLVRACIVCGLQVIFAIITDIITSFTWSLPQLLRGEETMIVKLWRGRANNMMWHLWTANWSSVVYCSYRVYMALHGAWHIDQ